MADSARCSHVHDTQGIAYDSGDRRAGKQTWIDRRSCETGQTNSAGGHRCIISILFDRAFKLLPCLLHDFAFRSAFSGAKNVPSAEYGLGCFIQAAPIPGRVGPVCRISADVAVGFFGHSNYRIDTGELACCWVVVAVLSFIGGL